MEFRILGPLEVLDEGRTVALGATKPRALLALLVLHRGETLGTERLIEELWGEHPPASAAKAVQVNVSRLRKALAPAGSELIVTRQHGYELAIEPELVDAERFERLMGQGRDELAVGDVEGAAAVFEEALSMWRGRPLDDLAYEPFAQREIARLDQLRVAAVEQLIEAKLALGRHVEVVAQLERLVAEHPYRERLWGQLMLALYRCDRQADALQAYQDARRTLVEELAIEPGERLRELERAILAQDPRLGLRVGDESAAPVAPGELPTGVVTFLLTDIEGSSGLWETDAVAMAAALEMHDELIAATAEAHGGRLLKAKGEGDATLTVFRRASDAVACAVELQRALGGASWPGGLDLRLRIALHTGEAHERDGDYFGPAVNRAARLRGLARGGTTVISQATAEIVHDRLPPTVELAELGSHQLRGLSRPENVFEIAGADSAVAGMPGAIGGLPASATARLPAPLTRAIGREADCAVITALLRRDEVRLVTLTGPGGVGKTRLALEVARELEPELADGAWFVSLAATARAEHVASAIAQAIGVAQLRGESSEAALEHFLARNAGLLVLDNFEHVLTAAPWVNDLLGACPAMKVLATSREALRLQGEQRHEVQPLPVPAEGRLAEVEQSPAAALFVERARSHDKAFELNAGNARAIAELCDRLDGLPLALELAAARSPMLGPEQLNARLAERLDLLSGGPRDAPERQRTLRATIDWSHRLLDPAEAEAFARFAVFAGGATIEAAEDVTGAGLDTLSGLVDKHLLLRRPGPRGDARLLMLETVREYASERLADSAGSAEVHSRHCGYFRALAERVDSELFTHGEAEWRPRLEAEVDNLRAALDWSLLNAPIEALELAGSLTLFWVVENSFREGLERVAAALDAAGEDAPTRARAKALVGQASLVPLADPLADVQGSVMRGRALATEALALFREIDDPAGVARSLIAQAWYDRDEPFAQPERLALVEEALTWARQADDRRLVPIALAERALALPPEQAGEEIERAAQALREVGDSWTLFTLYWYAAHNVLRSSNPERAGGLIDRALPVARELRDPADLMYEPPTEGLYALFIDELDRAQFAFEEQLWFCRDRAVARPAPAAIAGLAAIAARRTEDQRAAQLLGAATAIGPIEDAAVVEHLDDRFFTPARARLGERHWEEARAGGAQLSFDQAIALALSPGPHPE
jgi:predicted ATPase/DNA-binding SARP family transcriptional activator